jgi:hypothetical protein
MLPKRPLELQRHEATRTDLPLQCSTSNFIHIRSIRLQGRHHKITATPDMWPTRVRIQQVLIIAIELPRQVITQHKTASRPIFAFANIMWNDRRHLTTMCSRSLFLHQRCHRDVTAMASWDAYDVRHYLSYLFLCFHPLYTSENGELKTK